MITRDDVRPAHPQNNARQAIAPSRETAASRATPLGSRSLPSARSVGHAVALVAGIIEVLLALRFILLFSGANQGRGLFQLIFNVTRPFVQPFLSLFQYEPAYGYSHIETATLVALMVYGVVAWGIMYLLYPPSTEK